MKHLLTIFTLSLFLYSCGEEKDPTAEKQVDNNETVAVKDAGEESKDLTTLLDLDDQLVKNDLT